MNHATHSGSRGRYVEGCRCRPCKQANNRYHRTRRSRRINLPAQPLFDMFIGIPDEQVAQRLGVTRSTLARWRTNGLTMTVGDRVAVSLGMHPLIVFGPTYWKATL